EAGSLEQVPAQRGQLRGGLREGVPVHREPLSTARLTVGAKNPLGGNPPFRLVLSLIHRTNGGSAASRLGRTGRRGSNGTLPAERRYLIVPGLLSSRIYVIDTQPDPKNPKIVKVIEPEEVASRAGYSRPHTVHCGPDGIYVSALGNPAGDAPGGVFILDHDS